MLEQGPDFWCWFDTTQFSYIPLCSPNTCKYVFNPNVTTFQSNCAEGLQFSAFISLRFIAKNRRYDIHSVWISEEVSAFFTIDSRFLASSNNWGTQFAAGKTLSSSAQRVESTKLGMSNTSRCSVWSVLLSFATCGRV